MKNTYNILSPVTLILLYIVCVFSPYIMFFNLIYPLFIGLVFLFFTLSSLIKTKEKILSTLIFFFVIALIYWLGGISTANLGIYAEIFLWIISVWMAIYLWWYRSDSEREIVAIFVSVLFVINLIYTSIIRGLQSDYSSLEVEYIDKLELYARLNVGSTYVSMAALFYTLFIVSYIFVKSPELKGFKKKSLYVLSLFLIYFVVFYGDSTTTTITMIISLIFLIGTKRKNLLGSLFVLIALYVLFLTNVQVVADFCRTNINDRLADRLVALSHLSSQKSTSDDEGILSRFPMMWIDIKMWFSSLVSFLFGNGHHSYSTGDVMKDTLINKAGGHSAVFDTISRYGILGIALMSSLLKNVQKWYIENIAIRSVAINLFVVLLINNILNVTLYPCVLFIVFFFIPFLGYKR